MPTICPEVVARGPPESPGWIAAATPIRPVSCSEAPVDWSCAVMDWSSAVTVPPTALGVPPLPPALPIATTLSPVPTVDESPNGATVSPDAPDSCSTAMSWVRSYPTTLAWYVCPLPMSVTLMPVAPATTWLLVRTSPSAPRTIPVPAADPCSYPRMVLMSTIPGSTFAATEEI